MIGAFFGAMFMGHIYIIAIVTAVQIVSFKEVIAIANVPSRARRLRFTKALNWYWLATTMRRITDLSASCSTLLVGCGALRLDSGANRKQDSFSSLHPYKPAITAFNSHSSHGRIWHYT
jgi:CDP-diglyceride synthetase